VSAHALNAEEQPVSHASRGRSVSQGDDPAASAQALVPVAGTTAAAANAASSGAVEPQTERGGSRALVRAHYLKESAGLIKRVTKVVEGSGQTSTLAHVRRLTDIVFAARKEYDALHAEARRKEQLALRLEREAAAIADASSHPSHSTAQYEERVKTLEMQLDTVTIRISETEENRRNYELNIAHLKEVGMRRASVSIGPSSLRH
jgi:hypothetical protein